MTDIEVPPADYPSPARTQDKTRQDRPLRLVITGHWSGHHGSLVWPSRVQGLAITGTGLAITGTGPGHYRYRAWLLQAWLLQALAITGLGHYMPCLLQALAITGTGPGPVPYPVPGTPIPQYQVPIPHHTQVPIPTTQVPYPPPSPPRTWLSSSRTATVLTVFTDTVKNRAGRRPGLTHIRAWQTWPGRWDTGCLA